MPGVEAHRYLARYFDRLVRRQPADPAEKNREVIPIDVLHGDVVEAFRFPDIEDAADIRVRNLSRSPHFALEPGQQFLVRRKLFGQELQRHRLFEFKVLRFVHLSHASLTEKRQYPVSLRENGPGEKAAGSLRSRMARGSFRLLYFSRSVVGGFNGGRGVVAYARTAIRTGGMFGLKLSRAFWADGHRWLWDQYPER